MPSDPLPLDYFGVPPAAAWQFRSASRRDWIAAAVAVATVVAANPLAWWIVEGHAARKVAATLGPPGIATALLVAHGVALIVLMFGPTTREPGEPAARPVVAAVWLIALSMPLTGCGGCLGAAVAG